MLLHVLIVTAEQGQCHGGENKVLRENRGSTNRCCCSERVIITLALPNTEQLPEELWLLLTSLGDTRHPRDGDRHPKLLKATPVPAEG